MVLFVARLTGFLSNKEMISGFNCPVGKNLSDVAFTRLESQQKALRREISESYPVKGGCPWS